METKARRVRQTEAQRQYRARQQAAAAQLRTELEELRGAIAARDAEIDRLRSRASKGSSTRPVEDTVDDIVNAVIADAKVLGVDPLKVSRLETGWPRLRANIETMVGAMQDYAPDAAKNIRALVGK